MWTDGNLPDGLRRPESSQLLRSPAERSQLLRLELLRLFGGVYADADVVCRKPLEPALGGRTFAAATFPDGAPDDSLLAATSGHPAIDRLLDAFPATEYWGQPPATVAELLRDEPALELLPPGTVAFADDAGRDGAVALRLHERGRELQDSKQSALEAEEELARAQAETEAAARAAAQTAERELAELLAARRRGALARQD